MATRSNSPPRQHSLRPRSVRLVTFTRKELSVILDLYSHRVMDGAWRDYAIDHLPGSAVFSIYSHSLDRPLFSIAKTMGKSAEFAVYEGVKQLKRATNIKDAVRVLERKLEVVK